MGNPNCDPWGLKGTFNKGAAGGSADGLLPGGQGGSWMDAVVPPKPAYSGQNGAGEPGDPTVGGGIGGEIGWPGGLGAPGRPGAKGYPGLGDLDTSAALYVSLSGKAAGTGTRGAGGGGGGMGQNTCVPGSGGGAGGRPGVGGAGGKGGGGSIGVFAGAGAHALVVDGSVIHTANGGNGGNGGLGQPGGAGGQGGPPGVDIYDGKYPGTSGGNGGEGGAGGRGGGGAGGASIGVLAIDARAEVAADTQITLGSGGLFGVGGYNGWQGFALKTHQTTTAGGSLPPIGDFDGDGLPDAKDACPTAAGPGNGCPPPPAGGTQSGGGQTTPSTGSTGSARTVTVAVLPARSCLSKRVFRLRINARRARLRTGRLTVDARRVRLAKHRRIWTARIDLRRSARTRHTVTIRGKLKSGRRYKQVRRYWTCR